MLFGSRVFLGLVAVGVTTAPCWARDERPGPIQDNSFLVEEAYNQETGVVQHINTFQRFRDSKDWLYTFTQEWPVGGLAHQFSFTVPYTRLNASADGSSGVGDVALNYRYQLLGDGEAKLAISPRLSVFLPTGGSAQGRGSGAVGYQAALPLSWVLSEALVSHTNIGVSRTPSAKATNGDRATINAWSFGQGVVWLVRPRLNLMLEYVHARGETVSGPGTVDRARSAFLSPGIRWSYDFASGLQVVPGIALPIGVGPSRGEKSIFFYLSFEHPFAKTRE